MSWKLAESLEVLRDQINLAAPGRSTTSDGTIGDAAHSASTSDHNPNSKGDVCALDITHDPNDGVDCHKIAASIIASNDSRNKYIIWNKKISNPKVSNGAWRPYNGRNPHTLHMHLSVDEDYNDPRKWAIGGFVKQPEALKPITRPMLRRGSLGNDVRILQERLKIKVDGVFGPVTKKAVEAFQTKNNLVADGIVGSYTWEKLMS